jgi:hypothetical protein
MQNAGFQERRLFPRIPKRLSVRLVNLETKKWSLAKTHDISAKGIGLITENFLAAPAPLEMWLPIADKGESYYTKGRVVWSQRLAPAEYKTGIALEKMDLAGIAPFLLV